MIWGLGGPEEDHQLHHCCWTGRVSEQEEEEELTSTMIPKVRSFSEYLYMYLLKKFNIFLVYF